MATKEKQFFIYKFHRHITLTHIKIAYNVFIVLSPDIVHHHSASDWSEGVDEVALTIFPAAIYDLWVKSLHFF